MTLSNAFTIAWKDLKGGAAKVAEFLTKNSTNIQTVVTGVETVAAAVDPALAPVITEFDLLEEQVVGKVLELAGDVANAASLGSLFGTVWPVILSLKQQLSTHPAVLAATVMATSTAAATKGV
jgi:hypothetical protein